MVSKLLIVCNFVDTTTSKNRSNIKFLNILKVKFHKIPHFAVNLGTIFKLFKVYAISKAFKLSNVSVITKLWTFCVTKVIVRYCYTLPQNQFSK